MQHCRIIKFKNLKIVVYGCSITNFMILFHCLLVILIIMKFTTFFLSCPQLTEPSSTPPPHSNTEGVPAPERLRLTADVDATLARLIDSHLSHIYPVYWARTRAILIQQARERLVCGFDGSLVRFEQRFLCKFAQIAATLRTAHQIGEVRVL